MRHDRRGFTLVEMLVATALVMIMLLLFAQVFRGATGTVTEQRGLAQTDARARMMENLLRIDLRKGSFRQALTARNSQTDATTGVPSAATDPPYIGVQSEPQGIVPLFFGDRVDPRQLGYLYIGENDPSDATDDVLQFTTFVEEVSRDPDNQPYVGKATFLGSANDYNQPEYDDGIPNNLATRSRAAEVSYFCRAGTLYRRVLLLRDPLPNAVGYPADPTTNWTSGPATLMFENNYTLTGDSFWNDFDLAAFYEETPGDLHVHLHGIHSLDNARGDGNEPIAFPWHRFGHYCDPTYFTDPTMVGAGHGMPREYVNLVTAPLDSEEFFGRFTHQETSHNAFPWPGSNVNNPFTANLAFDNTQAGKVIQNTTLGVTWNGNRVGEDILMTNVDAFDVKVWDSQLDIDGDGQTEGGFRDVGHTETTGSFRQGQDKNDGYGSQTSANNVFDTWHPSAFAGTPTAPLYVQSPPYRPLQLELNDASVVPWSAGTATVGTIVRPSGTIDNSVGAPLVINGTGQVVANGSLLYRAVQIAGTGATGDYEPLWPRSPGQTVQDGAVTWMAFDNRIGLKMIQITIRFREPGTNASRQLTVVHSFVE